MDSYVNGKLTTTPDVSPSVPSVPTGARVSLEEEDALHLELFQYRKFLGDLDDGQTAQYAAEVLKFVDPSKQLPKDEVLLRLQRLAQQVGAIGDEPKKRIERLYAYVKASNSVHSIIMELT